MARGIRKWSTTAATNASADSGVNWAEGMAPSAVNDSARAEMASAAMWRDDNNGSIAATLATATYSATSNQTFDALAAGDTIAIQLGSDMPATALLNLDSLGAKPLRPYPGVDFAGGEYKSGTAIRAVYKTSNSGEWIVQGFRRLGSAAGEVITANIADNAVTLAKLATQADQTLLANISGGSAVPTAVTIGAGLTGSSGTLKSAFPPPSAFKNLSIKVASNTTVTVAADFVTTTDATTYQTTAVSSTVNLGTTGADALDTGTIAIDTWYAIWVIAKSDGTTKCLASTSFTSPTMPSGYTFKARIGAVQTIHASATLYGTHQYGKRAQYVVGLAQTATLPVITNGVVGTVDNVSPTLTATTVRGNGKVAPSTASRLSFIGFTNWKNGSSAIVQAAPNAGSYSGTNNGTIGSNGLVWPLWNQTAGSFVTVTEFALEADTIGLASNATGGVFVAIGWEDNI